MLSGMFSIRRITATVVGCLLAMSAVAARGQQQPPRPTSLARYVPANVKLFVRIRELGEVTAALSRSHAWRLLPLLSGAPPDGETWDLPTAINAFLGPQNPVDAAALTKSEIGLAAPSWSEVDKAVWLIRLADDDQLDRWFPKGRRRAESQTGEARSFTTEDGVVVRVRDNIAALARRQSARPLLRDVRALMVGGEGAITPLEQSSLYRELMSHLPGRELASALLVFDDPARAGRARRWPDLPLRETMIGLYERRGRVDLAIRAALSEPRKRASLSPQTIERMSRLPQTTLLAYAGRFDFSAAFTAALSDPQGGALRRYATLLAGLRRGADDGSELSIGPEFVLVWEQDPTRPTATPELALMVQSRDALAVRNAITEVAQKLTQLLQTAESLPAGAAPALALSDHLGTVIVHLALGAYARQSQFPFMQLLEDTEPAWAASGGWLMVSSSRAQLERLLDAANGLSPALASSPEVLDCIRPRVDRTSLAVLQLGLAADVLERWTRGVDSGNASLLNPSWWLDTGQLDPATAPYAWMPGVEFRRTTRPGWVEVAVVDAEGSGAPALEPGDRIIAVDGVVLKLDAPHEDLRQRCEKSTSKPGPTLRVWRDDGVVDVVVPDWAAEREFVGRIQQAGQAVRELASLGRTLHLVTWEVHAVEETRYSARLSLRFGANASP
ncbi:MAG: hypothetical protein HY763_03670 [Planctomycetes bacterium]|nr:hypothetical protein [Planctomycetota bacterium]